MADTLPAAPVQTTAPAVRSTDNTTAPPAAQPLQAPQAAPRDGVESPARQAAERAVSAGPVGPDVALAAPRPRRHLADPEPTWRAQWFNTVRQRQPVAGSSLYVDGISASDVLQGQAADCWLMASLASIAHTRPEVIRDLIRDNGDGTYTVRFHNGAGGRIAITVDDDLASVGSTPIYARSPDKKELWVAIVEKAYAQMYRRYSGLEGGYPEDAMKVLTGRGGRSISTWSSTDTLYSAIQAGQRNRRAMTVSSGFFTSVWQGIQQLHGYTVLGTQTVGRTRYVLVRNPLGKGELTSPYYDTDVAFEGRKTRKDGVFRMTIDDFRNSFSALTIEN